MLRGTIRKRPLTGLREAIKKKKLRNFGHCPKLRDPHPPLGWYGRIKYGRLALAQPPPPLPKFGHFDVKSLNVQNHGLRKFGSINFFSIKY